MAQGYIFDKLMNRKIEGKTDLASLEVINEVITENSDENIESLGELANNVNDINTDIEIIKSGAPLIHSFEVSLDQISLDSVHNLKVGDFIYSEADEVLGVLTLCNAESNQYQVQTVENQQLCLYSYLGSTCTKYTAESGTKLYKHEVYLDGETGDDSFTFIDTNSAPLLKTDSIATIAQRLLNAVSYVNYQFSTFGNSPFCRGYTLEFASDLSLIYFYCISDGTVIGGNADGDMISASSLSNLKDHVSAL